MTHIRIQTRSRSWWTIHVGQRLRRDRAIRDRLRAAGWRVVLLTSAALQRSRSLVVEVAG